MTNRPLKLPTLHPIVLGSLALLSGLFALGLGVKPPAAQAELVDSPKAVVDEAWQLINQNFVDNTFNHTNWQQVRQELLSREYTSSEQAYSAIRQAIADLNDPYTRFLDPEQFKSLSQQTSGELTGIGVVLAEDEQTNKVFILQSVPDSPASKAGLQSGDHIVEIDGTRTKGMDTQQVAALMRGEADTKVNLVVQRGKQSPFRITLSRAVIALRTVDYLVKQEGQHRIGYIRLKEFSSHAAEQVKDAIEKLTAQKVDAFVLDLRGNPGGLLDASLEIAKMWINRGMIVQMTDRNGLSDRFFADQSSLTDLPLVVLVDGNSASSSEILTGALQDNNRATVVGTKTFGKAFVQSVHELSDESGMTVTVAHYYTPKGTDISKKGITPDLVTSITELQALELSTSSNWLTSRHDPSYQQALQVLSQEISSRRETLSQLQSRQ
jgi:carboxyl-terminal processing protease